MLALVSQRLQGWLSRGVLAQSEELVMPLAVFVLGPSGVGKTAVVRSILGRNTHTQGRWTVSADGRHTAAGTYMAVLGGGDSLPHSRAVAQSMLDCLPAATVWLEGAQFGAWAMSYLRGRAMTLAVVLDAPTGILVARRANRGSVGISSSQLDQARRFAMRVSAGCQRIVVVDASRPLPVVVRDVLRVVRGF